MDDLPPDFNAEEYLRLNPDVKNAGVDPAKHFLLFGKKEHRQYKNYTLNEPICGYASPVDAQFHQNPKTKRSSISSHTNIWEWIRSIGNKNGIRVLEIGSRSVVSDSLWKTTIPNCEYTGFDVMPGKNVTVVGDAHCLSSYFKPNSFDLIISFAVFEHIAMPWVVAEEISKVLDIGGYICIETHFSFSEHELPWHFFQFNSQALEILFNPELGFEILDSGLDTPMVGRFSHFSADYLRGQPITDLYCHSSLIARKIFKTPIVDSNNNFDWKKIVKRIKAESMYPKKNRFITKFLLNPLFITWPIEANESVLA